MRTHDVIVIGAGAAGLAAARTLIDLGRKPIILEARDRIGGRAWTESASFGVPIDRGCGWLHSADENPWREIARELGIAVLEENPVWQSRVGARWMGEGDSARWDDAISGWFEAIAAAGEAGRDVPASSVIGDGPFRPLFDAIVTWACGVESRELSTLDYSRYRDTGNDWPVPEGYGALVARYGAGLPVRLSTPATLVRWGGKDIAVETPAGALTAGAVIITLPPSVLQAGGLYFDPPLPPAKQEAIAGIKVGTANKVFIAVEGDPFGMPDTSYGTSSADRRRVASLSFKPFGRSIVGGYLGGDLAEELELAGGGAIIDFVIGELADMFGSAVRPTLARRSRPAGSPIPGPAAPILLPGRAMPAPAAFSPSLSTADSSSLARPVRSTPSGPATVPTAPAYRPRRPPPSSLAVALTKFPESLRKNASSLARVLGFFNSFVIHLPYLAHSHEFPEGQAATSGGVSLQ